MIASLEVYIACLSVLALLLTHSQHSSLIDYQKKYYRLAIICNILFILLEAVWLFIDGTSFITINWILNILYFIIATAASYSWYLFSQYDALRNNTLSRQQMLVAFIPLLVVIALALTSPIHHMLFYFDQSNRYVRGPMYFIQPVISYGYLIYSSISSFYKFKICRQYTEKQRFRTLYRSILTTIFAGAIQIMYPDTLILCIGTTFSFLYIFLNFQEMGISKDALTGLNNRTAMYEYLNAIARQAALSHSIYIYVLDLDNFKSINDTLGHVEGDKALKEAGSVLKKSCMISSDFVARYGGDEFIMIHDTSRDLDPSVFSTHIQDVVRSYSLKYPIAFSIGYTLFDGNAETLQRTIENADAKMYQEKSGKQTRK